MPNSNDRKSRVIVAMSGGVDSSVAALLLAQQGYEVIGVTLRLWTVERPEATPLSRTCCSVEDIEDARRVCQTIGARHYVVNAEREFQAYVVDYFLAEYQRGRTPHPCIACNDRIKFDFLMERARQMDADYVATGHYARLRTDGDGRMRLLRGIDHSKDQSYVLFGLGQEQLRRTLLPVGGHTKERIRGLAQEAGLCVADKPDSQDICFIPQGDYRNFLQERVSSNPGDLVDTAGRVLGRHQGVEHFTIGQRRGLGITSSIPLYVVELEPEARRVVVGRREELLCHTLRAERVTWTAGPPPDGPIEVDAKIRYKASEAAATVTPEGDGALVRFREPQQAVTPGQAVVFYQDDEVLGGGFIHSAVRDPAPALP
jgi:tRNA-specific 2-thiouridylase